MEAKYEENRRGDEIKKSCCYSVKNLEVNNNQLDLLLLQFEIQWHQQRQ